MSQDKGISYMICNILEKANFETKVAKNTYWIPLSSLGSEKEANFEEIINESPQRKYERITNIFDAVKLYLMINYSVTNDVIGLKLNNIYWEIYKNTEEASISKSGCCSTDTAWLNFFLKKFSSEYGIFGIIREKGGGHCLNYVKIDSFYYFIDLANYTIDYRNYICHQSGLMSDFVKQKFITSNIIKAGSIEDYIMFLIKYNRISNNRCLYYTLQNDYSFPLGKYLNYKFCNNIIIAKQKKNLYKFYDFENPNLKLFFEDCPLLEN